MKKLLIQILALSSFCYAQAAGLSPDFHFFRYDYANEFSRSNGIIESKEFTLFSSMKAVEDSNLVTDFSKCSDGKMYTLMRVPHRKFQNPDQRNHFGNYLEHELRLYQGDQKTLLMTRRFELASSNEQTPTFVFSKNCRYLLQIDEHFDQWALEIGTGREIPIEKTEGIRQAYFNSNGDIYFLVWAQKENQILGLEVETGRLRKIFATEDLIESLSTDNWQEGSPLLAIRRLNTNPDFTYQVVELTTSGTKVLSKLKIDTKKSETMVNVRRFLDQGRIVLEKETVSSEMRTTLILDGKSQKVIASIPGTDLEYFKNGFYKIMRQEGSNEINPYLLDENFKVVAKLGFKDRFGNYNCSAKGGLLLCLFQSNFINQQIYEISSSNEMSEVFATNSIGKDIHGEKFVVKSTDNFQAPVYVFSRFRPENSKGVIIYVHGGGCHLNYHYDVTYYNPEFQELVRAGYTLVGVNYRNDLTYLPFNDAKSYPKELCGTKEIDDIIAARNALNNRYPNLPIFLWGHSQGGYLVNLMATKYAERAQWNGIISGAGMWKYTSSYEPSNMKKYYNAENAPINYLKNLRVPFLLFHGKEDTNVDFAHAKAFLDAIQFKENTSNLQIFTPKDEAHHIENWRNHEIWMQHFFKFLNTHEGRSF